MMLAAGSFPADTSGPAARQVQQGISQNSEYFVAANPPFAPGCCCSRFLPLWFFPLVFAQVPSLLFCFPVLSSLPGSPQGQGLRERPSRRNVWPYSNLQLLPRALYPLIR